MARKTIDTNIYKTSSMSNLNLLYFLEDKLQNLNGNLQLLSYLCDTDTIRNLAPGTELEIEDTLEWLYNNQDLPYPDYNFDEAESPKLNGAFLPSKLYGTDGEGRGAKQQNCKPGNRLCGTRCQAAELKCKYDESYKTLESQKFSVKEASGLSNSMPVDLRDKLSKKFPNVFSDPAKEKFLWHLMYSSHTLKNGSVLIPRDVMYRFAKDRDGDTFLKNFKEAMGTTPTAKNHYFDYKDYSYKYAKAREATLKLPPSIDKAFKEDLRHPNRDIPRVFSVGGMEYNEENKKLVRQAQASYAMEVAQSLKIDDQKNQAIYHARQKIEDMPKFYFKEAYKVAEAIENEDSRISALRILNNLQSNPLGYYRPSEVTTRMFSANGLQGLKSTVRAALVPEMQELDAISCHAHIIANIRNIPNLLDAAKDKIENDTSMWDRFEQDFKDAGYPWDKVTKGNVKTAFYSLCYGGTRQGTAKRLTQYARENPQYAYVAEKGFKDALFGNYIFRELTDAGNNWRKEMIIKGSECNVYGQCFTVDSQKKARSIQAAVTQSYETAYVNRVMYPRYEKGETDKDLSWINVYGALTVMAHLLKKVLQWSKS